VSPCVDIIRRDITVSFMIAPIIITPDKCFNRFSQLAWHLVGNELNISLDSTVVSILPLGESEEPVSNIVLQDLFLFLPPLKIPLCLPLLKGDA